jgi:hypothetical protein
MVTRRFKLLPPQAVPFRVKRCHRCAHIPASSIVAAIHLSMLVASFACAAGPSFHSESFQLGLGLALSSMRAPLVLIFRTFYVCSSSRGATRVHLSHDARTRAPLILRPLFRVRPSLILAHIPCTGSLPLPTFHAISIPSCIIFPLPPLHVCHIFQSLHLSNRLFLHGTPWPHA